MPEPQCTIELTDPRALRALAHPTRLSIVGLLRREGPLTATQAGERIGQSAASCSFHLRQLAKYGLVEEAGGGRGRERPWRATARFTSWKVEADENADAAAALSSLIVERQLERLLAWFERMPDEPADWQQAHQLGDTLLYLTPTELQALGERVWELLSSLEREQPRKGTRAVQLFFAGFPRPEE
jgi:DNA-binding transcriptional ArsR family regulator